MVVKKGSKASRKGINPHRTHTRNRNHRIPLLLKTWKNNAKQKIAMLKEKMKSPILRNLIRGQTLKIRRLQDWRPKPPNVRDRRFQTNVAASVCTSALMALVPGGMLVNVAKNASAMIITNAITDAYCNDDGSRNARHGRGRSPIDEALDMAKRSRSRERGRSSSSRSPQRYMKNGHICTKKEGGRKDIDIDHDQHKKHRRSSTPPINEVMIMAKRTESFK